MMSAPSIPEVHKLYLPVTVRMVCILRFGRQIQRIKPHKSRNDIDYALHRVGKHRVGIGKIPSEKFGDEERNSDDGDIALKGEILLVG